jgi:regulator of RNase E activity RraA
MNPTAEATDLGHWRDVPASVVSDMVGRFGAMTGAIRQLTGTGVIGPAHTLRVVAGDNKSIHLALPSVPPGSVLVIDAGGYLDRAVWGEVLTITAMRIGIAGAVIDGATRDLADIEALGFPVYARGTTPAGPHKAGGGVSGALISCGGVPVAQGDLVIGDADGVAVVPAAQISSVYHQARARMAAEQGWIDRIQAGESSASALGLSEK